MKIAKPMLLVALLVIGVLVAGCLPTTREQAAQPANLTVLLEDSAPPVQAGAAPSGTEPVQVSRPLASSEIAVPSASDQGIDVATEDVASEEAAGEDLASENQAGEQINNLSHFAMLLLQNRACSA